MKQTHYPTSYFLVGILLGIIVILASIAALLGGFTFKSIVGDTHTYTVFNQTWTASPYQGWGTVPTNCALGGRHNGLASYVTTEENTSSFLHLSASTPNSFGNECDFTTGMAVTLQSVDLRDYSAGRIHRSVNMNFYGGKRVSYSASINDLLIDAGSADTTFNQNYGDITWTNDGNTITLKSDEYPNGKLITIGNTPVRLTMMDTIATAAAPSSTGMVEIFITGIDLVPMPASVKNATTTIPIPPPVSAQPVPNASVSLPSTQLPLPVPVGSSSVPAWWDSFLANVSGAWHQFLGWFGVHA